MPTMLRASRVPVRISGPGAAKFLFDVLTARVLAEPGPGQWWALLSPQGKIQAEGLITYADSAFWLDVQADIADAFLKKLRLYKLRAELDITDMRATHRIGWDPSADDPRGPGIGGRVIATTEATGDWVADEEPFRRARAAFGLLELGPDFAPDAVFPHDIGMDLLGGVDFAKGCYIGQEVVSRMQHRGTARRRPVIVDGLVADVPSGTPVLAGDREAGTIGTPVDGKAVAILRLDRVPEGSGATVAGRPVMLRVPRWATYQLGDAQPAGGD